MKKLVFLLSLLLLAAALLLPVGATSFESPIDDAAGLLADPEAYISASTCNCSNNGVRYFLVTDTAASAFSDAQMIDRCHLTEEDNAIILLVRYTGGKYYYDMYTYGDIYDAFSDADIDAILDDPEVYNNIKSGNIEEGALAWKELSSKIASPYMLEKIEKERRWEETRVLRTVIISAVVFLLTGGGAVLGVFLYYRKKVHGEVYPLDRYARLDLTHQSDRFVGSFVTRTRINTSSGSGGRSGGGRSGGVSGGHRGGR